MADGERSRREAVAGECHADDGRGGVQPHVHFDREVFELNLGCAVMKKERRVL